MLSGDAFGRNSKGPKTPLQGLHRLDQSGDVGKLRHVGLDRQGAAANALNLSANRLRFGLAMLEVYSHVGTGLGQGQSRRPPDAPAGPRDESDTACQCPGWLWIVRPWQQSFEQFGEELLHGLP